MMARHTLFVMVISSVVALRLVSGAQPFSHHRHHFHEGSQSKMQGNVPLTQKGPLPMRFATHTTQFIAPQSIIGPNGFGFALFSPTATANLQSGIFAAAFGVLLGVIGKVLLQPRKPHMAMWSTASSSDEVDVDQMDAQVFVTYNSSSSNVITPKERDYSRWYQQVIACADLIDVSPVRGCMVLKPNGYAIWDFIREDLDRRFKATGHRNAYFPLFIPQSFFSKEAEHVEGFAKECAVVTHHRLRAVVKPDGRPGVEPDPEAKLEEALVVRPTSETMIWNMFARWISSYRDLPLLINQWANVVRWEMRTRPFLRSSEFLWQEGHTAHATQEEAIGEAKRMQQVYADFCAQVLAIPVVKGEKSAHERFAGAERTFTIEALMQNGWALQAGTSHFLGQNFARAFEVKFQDAQGGRQLVWATSWGVSTRLIGALIMTHSDNTGLVLPPGVAPTQVVLIPILKKTGQEVVLSLVEEVRQLLAPHFRVEVDARGIKPGSKYYEWERKGVPLRMEVGPRDAEGRVVCCGLRNGGAKFSLPVNDDLVIAVRRVFGEMHTGLLTAAEERLKGQTYRVATYNEMRSQLDGGGFFLVPWRADDDNEQLIKEQCRATLRCYPEDHQLEAVGQTCFFSGEPATHMALFARAY
eukprot:GGOE01037192.1.p1 GENE.GGOE01037192.1~~GGOE01037192.1.p1  ORF type:complete len:640 (+),score=132.36 GGOE01037192.1:117-2036(+)